MTGADGSTVIVLRALGLGDLCTAVPALRALRAHLPEHRLLLAAPSWQLPLARAAGVDGIVAVPSAVATAEDLVALPEDLMGCDVAVNLHGAGPRSTELLAGLAPRRLIAFGHPSVARTAGSPRWRDDEHEVRRWCRLLAEEGVPADPGDLLLPPPVDRPMAPGSVVVHPGAAAVARQWPEERYACVVATLLQEGHRVSLTGSATEAGRCERIAGLAGAGSAGGGIDVLAGRTSLTELAATVAAASAVITNDTGVAHLATAYSTPSVVLFGPTPPALWGPPPSGTNRALWKGVAGDPHADTVHVGMLAIEVDEVLDAVGQVLAASATATGARA